MINSLLTFVKASKTEGKRIESNLRTVKEKQIKHDSFANLNQY